VSRLRTTLLVLLGCAHAAPPEPPKPPAVEADVVQAQFAAAKEDYDEGRYEDAARRLHALADRPGLKPLDRGSALLQEGVCRTERASAPRARRCCGSRWRSSIGKPPSSRSIPPCGRRPSTGWARPTIANFAKS